MKKIWKYLLIILAGFYIISLLYHVFTGTLGMNCGVKIISQSDTAIEVKFIEYGTTGSYFSPKEDTWKFVKQHPNLTSLSVILVVSKVDEYGNKTKGPDTKLVYDADALLQVRKYANSEAFRLSDKGDPGRVYYWENNEWVDILDSQRFEQDIDSITE